MIIRKANPQDAKEINRIAMQNSLGSICEGDTSNGFLVSGFSTEVYCNYIEHLQHFYLLTSDSDQIRAFLLAYTPQELDTSLIVNQAIMERAKAGFVVIKQICVDRNQSKKGYATQLYNFIEHKLKCDIYLAIVSQPVNVASINFHVKLGYKHEFSIIAEDNLDRAIYYKPYTS